MKLSVVKRELALGTATFAIALAWTGCATPRKAPLLGRPAPAPPPTTEHTAIMSAAPSAKARAALVEAKDFTLPIPAGYRDASSEYANERILVVLTANGPKNGYDTTITVQKVPIPGGSFDDPEECIRTGHGLVSGGTDAPGTGGTLKSADIIAGPVGKTCQIQLVAPQGVAIVTELHQPGNTPSTPKEIWLMTCNHSDGDEVAESVCRFVLAGFRFRHP